MYSEEQLEQEQSLWYIQIDNYLESTFYVNKPVNKAQIVALMKRGWGLYEKWIAWGTQNQRPGRVDFSRRQKSRQQMDFIKEKITWLWNHDGNISEQEYVQIRENCVSTNNPYLVSIA